MERLKVGDIQKKSGFVSTSADEGWAAPSPVLARFICVDCGVHQAVCKDRQVAHNGDEPNFASAPDASFVGFFDVWTGSVWRRYDGVKDAQTLANWLGSGAWQRDDGPHLTTPEQNWRDPWVQSFAKHAARSSHTSWETMRQPWADWAPCDADDKE